MSFIPVNKAQTLIQKFFELVDNDNSVLLVEDGDTTREAASVLDQMRLEVGQRPSSWKVGEGLVIDRITEPQQDEIQARGLGTPA